MEVDFSARVTAYQSARERLELLKDGVPNKQKFLKVYENSVVQITLRIKRFSAVPFVKVFTGLPRMSFPSPLVVCPRREVERQ